MIRRLLLGLSLALSGILVLASATLAYAQTRTGKTQILGVVEAALSDEQQQAAAEELSGFLPFNFELGRIALSDDEGTWLEAEGVHARLSPADLLRGFVRVTEAGAERVAVHRAPAGEARPAPTREPMAPPRLPEPGELLPDLLPAVAVDRLLVRRIELGEALLGEAAVFTLEGRAVPSDDFREIAAELELARTDEPTARIGLEARLALAEQTLALLVEAEETGGLAGRLAGMPEAGPLLLRLEGQGPLADWRAELAAEVEQLVRVDGTLGLGLGEVLRLDLAASLVPGPLLLPAEVGGLIGERADLALRLRQTAEQEITVDELNLATAAAALTGDGRLDFEAQSLVARLALAAEDLSRLEAAVGTPLAGALRADLTASGALTQPELDLTLAGRDLRAGGLLASRLDTELHVAFLESLTEVYAGFEASGSGRAERLALVDGPPLPDDTLVWRFAATVPPDDLWRLERLEAEGAGVTLTASGQLDPQAQLAEGSLSLAVEELAVLAAALGPEGVPGMDLTGAARLDADLTLAEDGQAVSGRIDGRLEDLAGLPPAAAELLGRSPTLGADVLFRPGEVARIGGLNIRGAAAQLAGDVGVDLASRALDGQVRLELPQLAALEPALGQALAGALTAEAALGGTIEAPDLRLDARSDGILLGERRFERLVLEATAAGPFDDLGGRLDLALDHQGQRLALGAGYRLAGERLSVPELRLSGPQTEIAGSLEADLAAPLVEGEINGRIGDLAALQPWHQQELAGQVELAAVLAAVEGRQDASLRLAAESVVGEFGSVAALRLDARARDLFGTLALSGQGEIDEFQREETRIERVEIAAEGDLRALSLTATAVGELPDTFDVRARAQLALLDDVMRLRVEQLEGRLAQDALRLRSPATLELEDGTLRLDELDLLIGSASLRTRADLGPERVSALAELRDLSLATLRRFGGPDLEGELAASARLAGTRAAPTLDLDLRLAGLTALDPMLDPLPPADLLVNASLAGGRLEARASLERLTERPMAAWLSVPLSLTLEPFAYALPEDGAIAGWLEAEASLQRIVLLAAIDNQRVAGELRGFLELDGTVGEPRLQGELVVIDGAYEHADTGTVLRDIHLLLRGTEQRLVVEELRASDGGAGVVTGRGELRFLAAQSFPFELEVDFDDARLLRRADADATLSGQLALAGNFQDALLSGRVVVEQAELGIPELDGPQVATIEVEEVGNGVQPAAGRPSEPMRVRLDLVVDMPARVFLRGRGLDSEWAGRLDVQGVANRPEIVGTIRNIRGHIDLLDRRYTLRESVIDFDGASPPAPVLNITAETETRELVALVRIEGRVPEITLMLDSEPSLPQDEILAHVLFDRDLSRVTPGQAVRLAAAVNALAGRADGGFDVMGRLRSATGLTVLDVGGESIEEGTLRAGTYVSEDVYIEVERGLSAGTGRATVEVELGRNLKAETRVTESGGTGIGLKWRYDY